MQWMAPHGVEAILILDFTSPQAWVSIVIAGLDHVQESCNQLICWLLLAILKIDFIQPTHPPTHPGRDFFHTVAAHSFYFLGRSTYLVLFKLVDNQVIVQFFRALPILLKTLSFSQPIFLATPTLFLFFSTFWNNQIFIFLYKIDTL